MRSEISSERTSHQQPVSLHILILETDVLPANSGNPTTAFQELFARVGREQTRKIAVETSSVYVVEGKLPPIDDVRKYDGILITGSKHDAHGDDKWILNLIKWLQG
jgi:GMP synthase-like glutamine amidotransferase